MCEWRLCWFADVFAAKGFATKPVAAQNKRRGFASETRGQYRFLEGGHENVEEFNISTQKKQKQNKKMKESFHLFESGRNRQNKKKKRTKKKREKKKKKKLDRIVSFYYVFSCSSVIIPHSTCVSSCSF